MSAETQWKVRRQVDVNHKPGLVKALMEVKRGQRGASPDVYILADKFRYLRGDLDEQIAQHREFMGRKIDTGHPFIPRPHIWQTELARIFRKAWYKSDTISYDNLAIWEREFLVLGMAFEKDALDAGNGTWQRMYRIEMVLKRGRILPEPDQLFHDELLASAPPDIRSLYALG